MSRSNSKWYFCVILRLACYTSSADEFCFETENLKIFKRINEHQSNHKTGWYFSQSMSPLWVNQLPPYTAHCEKTAKELVDTTKEGVMDVRNSNETHTNNTSGPTKNHRGRQEGERNLPKKICWPKKAQTHMVKMQIIDSFLEWRRFYGRVEMEF